MTTPRFWTVSFIMTSAEASCRAHRPKPRIGPYRLLILDVLLNADVEILAVPVSDIARQAGSGSHEGNCHARPWSPGPA